MSGFQITITQAGIAALINAQNNGTNAVLVTQVGVTAQAFTPDSGMTALPGETKRIATFSGQAVADDTIHITVRDDTNDAYTLRGFGLYLQDGTLFALYGQATAIMEKSAQAMLLLAADIRFVDVLATSITFGDAVWVNPPATTEVLGVVELATSAEAIAGSDPLRAMTPAADKAAMDDRFGAGAPSGFVKGLLTQATAALFRVAIGLGDLSTRNGGSGNGADADLLDGQHGSYYRAWANFTGVPSTFPPSAHNQDWSTIDNKPSTATRWPDWAEVTGKPGSFNPAAHTHAAADVTSGVFDPARIPDLAMVKVTGLQTALNTKASLNANVSFGDVFSAGSVTVYDASFGMKKSTVNNNLQLTGWDTLEYKSLGIGYTATVWHSVNFNPTTKANIGSDSAGFIRLAGGGNAYYIVDRNSGRDWGIYAINDSLRIWNGAGDALQVSPSGVIACGGISASGPISGTTIAASSSDARLKNDIADLRGCLTTVLKLRPRAWRWKETGAEDFGWIAQEHREVIPAAIHEDEAGMLFVRYGKAEALIVGAIQEIAARLEALEARVLGAAK